MYLHEKLKARRVYLHALPHAYKEKLKQGDALPCPFMGSLKQGLHISLQFHVPTWKSKAGNYAARRYRTEGAQVITEMTLNKSDTE